MCVCLCLCVRACVGVCSPPRPKRLTCALLGIRPRPQCNTNPPPLPEKIQTTCIYSLFSWIIVFVWDTTKQKKHNQCVFSQFLFSSLSEHEGAYVQQYTCQQHFGQRHVQTVPSVHKHYNVTVKSRAATSGVAVKIFGSDHSLFP